MHSFLEVANKNKDNIIFINKHFKPIKKQKKLTSLEFHNLMLITFPFELKSYQFWVENIMLYNIHKEFIITY